MKYKRMIYFVSGAACLFLAAGLILYPILGNALAEKNKSLVMTEYSRAVEEMTDTRVAEILAAAETYNAALSPISVSADGAFSLTGLTAAQKEYDEILAVNESGIMGQLEIPELDIRLPIYHGTDGSTLEKGVGHLLGSSFPVGGKGTHTDSSCMCWIGRWRMKCRIFLLSSRMIRRISASSRMKTCARSSPVRRMASIRTVCWCKGIVSPMSRKPFQRRLQKQLKRIAEFPAGSSSTSTAYITALFWRTP